MVVLKLYLFLHFCILRAILYYYDHRAPVILFSFCSALTVASATQSELPSKLHREMMIVPFCLVMESGSHSASAQFHITGGGPVRSVGHAHKSNLQVLFTLSLLECPEIFILWSSYRFQSHIFYDKTSINSPRYL